MLPCKPPRPCPQSSHPRANNLHASIQFTFVSALPAPAALRPFEQGVKHTVRRAVQPVPPFEDAHLPKGGPACVLLTCRPGVVVPPAEHTAGLPQVIVQEEVVACPPRQEEHMV